MLVNREQDGTQFPNRGCTLIDVNSRSFASISGFWGVPFWLEHPNRPGQSMSWKADLPQDLQKLESVLRSPRI